MRQIWITKAGPPEVLQIKETDDPTPGPGEVTVRVEASGINFADIMARMGAYPDLPGIPYVVGYEVAGKVEQLGEGVDPDLAGKDVVCLTRFGGYSDVVVLPTAQVFVRPPGLDAHTAAGMPVNYLTAWQLIVAMGSLKPYETVLIHSAGGGVGIAAVQIAKHIGARVIGTASESKHDYLRSIGVDHCIDYRQQDFAEEALRITDGRGVELICDPIGGDYWRKGFRALAPSGRMGMFGASATVNGKKRSLLAGLRFLWGTPWTQFNPVALMNQNKGVFGVNLGRMWGEAELASRWMREVLRLFEEGVVKPRVDTTFAFDDAPAAHHYIQDRKNVGKVLLVP